MDGVTAYVTLETVVMCAGRTLETRASRAVVIGALMKKAGPPWGSR